MAVAWGTMSSGKDAATSGGAVAVAASSGGAGEVFVTQTHNMVVAITDESGRNSGTTRIGSVETTGIGNTQITKL